MAAVDEGLRCLCKQWVMVGGISVCLCVRQGLPAAFFFGISSIQVQLAAFSAA